MQPVIFWSIFRESDPASVLDIFGDVSKEGHKLLAVPRHCSRETQLLKIAGPRCSYIRIGLLASTTIDAY